LTLVEVTVAVSTLCVANPDEVETPAFWEAGFVSSEGDFDAEVVEDVNNLDFMYCCLVVCGGEEGAASVMFSVLGELEMPAFSEAGFVGRRSG